MAMAIYLRGLTDRETTDLTDAIDADSGKLAAMIAGGLHGVEQELPLEDELTGNAYTSGRPKVPGTMPVAREVFATSTITRAALGDEVVDRLRG